MLRYGLAATPYETVPSGRYALRILTNDKLAKKFLGHSLYVETPNGIRYYLRDSGAFEAPVGEDHRDQCLATFGALGLPETTPILLNSRQYTIGDLVSESVANFTFDQTEIVWTIMALAAYLPPQNRWENRFGRTYTFSQVIAHLLDDRQLNRASCAGTHILQALVHIDAADENTRHRLINEDVHSRLTEYIRTKLHHIARYQTEHGWWTTSWCKELSSESNSNVPDYRQRLLVTGHLLEILSSIPSTYDCKDIDYQFAVTWITRTLIRKELPAEDLSVCPITHALRSVAYFTQSSKKTLANAAERG